MIFPPPHHIEDRPTDRPSVCLNQPPSEKEMMLNQNQMIILDDDDSMESRENGPR